MLDYSAIKCWLGLEGKRQDCEQDQGQEQNLDVCVTMIGKMFPWRESILSFVKAVVWDENLDGKSKKSKRNSTFSKPWVFLGCLDLGASMWELGKVVVEGESAMVWWTLFPLHYMLLLLDAVVSALPCLKLEMAAWLWDRN